MPRQESATRKAIDNPIRVAHKGKILSPKTLGSGFMGQCCAHLPAEG